MSAREDAKHLTPAEHTPGPWRYAPSIDAPGSFYIAQPAHSLTLAHVHNFPDQMEANARLIASAPALLAACEAQQLVSDLLDICQDETERLFAKVAALGISVPETATAANWKQTAYYLADCVSDTAMDMRHAAIAQARGNK